MKRLQPMLALCALALTVVCLLGADPVAAQDSAIGTGGRSATAAANADNLEMQLYVLVGSGTPSETGTVPSSLNSLAREIRSTFQVSQVRLAAILQYRVENNGRLEASGLANSILTTPSVFPSYTSVSYGYSIASIKLTTETARPMVQLAGVRFSLQLPVQTGFTGNTKEPNVDFKSMGIATGVTLAIGEPAIVGSFTVGKVDEVVVLVMVVKPVNNR